MMPLLRLLLPVLCACAVGPGAAAPPAADPPKSHVLHLGATISVLWQGELRPVVDASGYSFVIEVNGKRITLPENDGQLQVRMDSTLKLSPWSATVERLTSVQLYTEENNPHRSIEAGVMRAQDAVAVADLAAMEMRALERLATLYRPGGNLNPALRQQLQAAEQRHTDSLHALGADINSPAGQPERITGSAGQHRYDAFSVSFDLASPRPLARPYAVGVVRYLDQTERRIAVFPLALPRVDEKPRRVRMFRGGFPPGYQLERFDLHVYDGGREVATTVSSKRLELTREDAFQFALVEHLADPDKATQPPVPAREFWPADLPARLNADNLNRILFAQVDKHGHATGAFHDRAGKLRITDADIVALLPELRFLPALENGKPVPGVCQINLGDDPL
jgi:hypothetical protein